MAQTSSTTSSDGPDTLSLVRPSLDDNALEERLTEVERRINDPRTLVERMDAIGDKLYVIEDKIKTAGRDMQTGGGRSRGDNDSLHERPSDDDESDKPRTVPRGKKPEGRLSWDEARARESQSRPQLGQGHVERRIGALQTRLEHGVGRLEGKISELEEKLLEMERKAQERVEIVEGKMDQLVVLLEQVLGAANRRAASSQAEHVHANRTPERKE